MRFGVVSGGVIRRLIEGDPETCVRTVEDVYLAGHRGEVVCPNSYFLRFPDRPDARIIALPAHLGGDDPVSGIKWIASYPANIQRGIPRASAVIVLNRADDGYPYACLEGSIISAARTAASAASAAAALSGRRAARTLGVVGTGLIARYVVSFLTRLGWEIPEVLLFDANPAEAERFRSAFCDPARHRAIRVAEDLEAVVRRSDLLVFTTSAGAPHVHDPGWFSHAPVVLHLSLRDLSPSVVRASFNVVDSVEHVMSAGTSLHLAEQESGHREFVTGTLAEVLLGKCAVPRTKTIVFSPFGMGTLDLAVARWVYARAEAAGDVVWIDDFFDMTR
ncbi:2,3-diaminopropionate biosynthesis protein SbnB [Sorangium sp. So ce1036]|uniref:2,3-diaminopropionate biosynthesis protein SbnB n=1 Tax=Sorangium sp. So ce1036 TaxID=3133328 RepID=UPI003F0B7A64